jgi:hypothetical protein
MRLASRPLVHLRTRIARALVALVIVASALVAVGATAPADAPFTIAIHPVLATLGIDVEVRLWSVHVHYAWSALQAAASTKTGGALI